MILILPQIVIPKFPQDPSPIHLLKSRTRSGGRRQFQGRVRLRVADPVSIAEAQRVVAAAVAIAALAPTAVGMFKLKFCRCTN